MDDGTILWDLTLLAHHRKIYDSIGRLKGEDNKMDGATSRLTHLLDRLFFSHFNLTFPLKNSLAYATTYIRVQVAADLHDEKNLLTQVFLEIS